MWLYDDNVTQQLDRRDFKSKDLSHTSWRAPVESTFTRSISFLLVVTKPGSDCSRLPIKAPKEDEEEEIQEARELLLMSLAWMSRLFYQLDSIFTSNPTMGS